MFFHAYIKPDSSVHAYHRKAGVTDVMVGGAWFIFSEKSGRYECPTELTDEQLKALEKNTTVVLEAHTVSVERLSQSSEHAT